MNRRLPWLILLLSLAGFGWGVFHLFRLRFEAGDVYPPYSSLRPDPLGTMAFYESLERSPGLRVQRDFDARNRLPEGARTLYLHLAGRVEDWRWVPEDLVKEIDRFVLNGGRLVIAFFPETSRLFHSFGSPGLRGLTNSPPSGKSTPGRQRDPGMGQTSLQDHWGVGFGWEPLKVGPAGEFEPVQITNRTDLPLPAAVTWHSGLVLTNLAESWRTIYSRQAWPVVAERRFGAGTIVLATDSYFLSNEALRRERHADLLVWLVGPVEHVVFDEAHLGVVESPGVATLLRKYRLEWLAAGLGLLAGLFIWRNSLSFLPQYPDSIRQDFVPGKDAAAGFINLLRRNIPPRDLLRVCFAEWTKSLAQDTAHPIARIDKAQAIIEAQADRNPVEAYREICHALKGK